MFSQDDLILQYLRQQAKALGFAEVGVSDVNLHRAEQGLLDWLAAGFHGQMQYMAAHGLKRARPAELVPGTVSVVTAVMDYLPSSTREDWQKRELDRLECQQQAVISLYARGRDYHKVLRHRLQKLAGSLESKLGPFGYRVFTDSAPVLEVELAARAGLGWRGKHTLLLSRQGSMRFIGEIYINCALPTTPVASAHCGSCSACIAACPTRAIVAPYRLDARRCISYLTIEHSGAIPLELRPLMGNRIYGCDDCQLVCPWNRFAGTSTLSDFATREDMSGSSIARMIEWDKMTFLRLTEGSPIRRIGYARWQRNLAVAAGNALGHCRTSENDKHAIKRVLQAVLPAADALVQEHVIWALAQG